MKIVIFGSGGQLGQEWTHFLTSAGSTVKGYTHRDLDITDERAVGEQLREGRPDVVINCAAFTDVDRAENDRSEAEKVNAGAVRSLARRCSDLNIKLVYFSTDYVFRGTKGDRIKFPDGYPEDHTPSPVNWYGETKLRGEQAIRESGADFLIVRTSWLCGRYGSNFVKTMCRLAEIKDRVDVVNDQWGSPSFTENVVFNTYNLLRKNREGIYNITTDGLITWFELARAIFGLTSKNAVVNPVSSGQFKQVAARPHFSKLSVEKLRMVKDAEIWHWEEGLRRLMNQLD